MIVEGVVVQYPIFIPDRIIFGTTSVFTSSKIDGFKFVDFVAEEHFIIGIVEYDLLFLQGLGRLINLF